MLTKVIEDQAPATEEPVTKKSRLSGEVNLLKSNCNSTFAFMGVYNFYFIFIAQVWNFCWEITVRYKK